MWVCGCVGVWVSMQVGELVGERAGEHAGECVGELSFQCLRPSGRRQKTKMRNVKLQHKWGHNKERGCVIFLVTKVALSKVPS
jgi:hypothetical protein